MKMLKRVEVMGQPRKQTELDRGVFSLWTKRGGKKKEEIYYVLI